MNSFIRPFGVMLLLLILLGATLSCSDESYSADPAYRLTFSADTVRFDTLLTTVGSRTRTLTIYNRNKHGVRIPLVRLGKGAESPFRVNVDGQYLYAGEGADFEIPGGDSIFARLEFTAAITDGLDVEAVEDVLSFTLENGSVQSLQLSGAVMDAQFEQSIIVKNDTILASTRPIVIRDSIYVAPDVTLTIGSGTTLMFHSEAGIVVDGNLRINGTQEAPVVLRSDQTEHMFDYLLYDQTPSRWGGITIRSTSADNCLNYCDVHAASFGVVVQGEPASQPSLTIRNSILHNLGGDGLSLTNCNTRVSNSQISNTKGKCVDINGGSHDFEHCTIAQFYPFVADRGAALYLRGGALQDDMPEAPQWLRHAHFVNCVITGYGEDVIFGEISESAELPVDYLFWHCYLNTVASEDTIRFHRVVYDTDEQPLPREKNFVLFDTDNYIYDFTPADSSTIRGLADVRFTPDTDRLGRPRRMAGQADAGCYEGQ